MKLVKCDINSNDFIGFVEIELPKLSERLRLAASSQVDLATLKEGETNNKEKILSSADMLDMTEKYVKTVSLKKGLREFKCLEDLQYDEDCSMVLFEIVGLILSGNKAPKVPNV